MVKSGRPKILVAVQVEEVAMVDNQSGRGAPMEVKVVAGDHNHHDNQVAVGEGMACHRIPVGVVLPFFALKAQDVKKIPCKINHKIMALPTYVVYFSSGSIFYTYTTLQPMAYNPKYSEKHVISHLFQIVAINFMLLATRFCISMHSLNNQSLLSTL